MLSYWMNMRVLILDSGGPFLSSLLHTHELKCLYAYQVSSSSCETRKKKLHKKQPSLLRRKGHEVSMKNKMVILKGIGERIKTWSLGEKVPTCARLPGVFSVHCPESRMTTLMFIKQLSTLWSRVGPFSSQTSWILYELAKITQTKTECWYLIWRLCMSDNPTETPTANIFGKELYYSWLHADVVISLNIYFRSLK